EGEHLRARRQRALGRLRDERLRARELRGLLERPRSGIRLAAMPAAPHRRGHDRDRRAARCRPAPNDRRKPFAEWSPAQRRCILALLQENAVSQTQSPSHPLYSDRATGQVFPDARTMVNAYLARFGERAGTSLESLDDSGYTQVRKGSAHVGVNVLD